MLNVMHFFLVLTNLFLPHDSCHKVSCNYLSPFLKSLANEKSKGAKRDSSPKKSDPKMTHVCSSDKALYRV